MPRYKIIVEYDGAPFAGWQYQENSPSVQRAIMTAIEAFSGEKVMVQGAGRTDHGADQRNAICRTTRGKLGSVAPRSNCSANQPGQRYTRTA